MRRGHHVVEAKHGHISVVGGTILVDSGWGASAFVVLTPVEMVELLELLNAQVSGGQDTS
jgi:hypothetical protein